MPAEARLWILLAAASSLAGCAAMGTESAAKLGTGYPAPEARAAEAAAELDGAVALVAQLKYSQAQAKLAPLVCIFQSARDDQRAAEAMFWLGYCSEKQGCNDRAAGFYRQVVGAYPSSAAARLAGARLAATVGATETQPATAPNRGWHGGRCSPPCRTLPSCTRPTDACLRGRKHGTRRA